MAKGDSRYARSSRGGSGYTRTYVYDDEGRGRSASLWDRFEYLYTRAEAKTDWLLNIDAIGLPDDFLLACCDNMRDRYGVHDFAWHKYDDAEANDGRMRRIIIKLSGLDVWHRFQARAKNLYDAREVELAKRELERSEEHAEQQAHFKAERIKRAQQERLEARNAGELVAGSLRSDVQSVLTPTERVDSQEGEWLDDPVRAVTDGRGFGYSSTELSTGMKLQITVALDLSNSMIANRVAEQAATAFRDIYVGLEMLRQEHLGNVFVGAFEFCVNGFSATELGRRANCLSYTNYAGEIALTDTSLGAVDAYRGGSNMRYKFTGEDTWLYPLFQAIEEWETQHSDPGAVKLDLIITDAVVEHPSDIRRSDTIQARRGTNVYTVMLNLLDESEWVNSDLPIRCVQYPANVKYLPGLIRSVVAEFIGMYL